MADAIGGHQRDAGGNGELALARAPPGTGRRAVIMAMQAGEGRCLALGAMIMFAMIVFAVVVAGMIVMIIMVVIVDVPRMSMVVTGAGAVIMVVLMIVSWLCSHGRRRCAGQGRNLVAEATDPILDRAEILAVAMLDRHRACRHRHRDVLHAGDAAHGLVDLAGAGGTVHALHAVTGLGRSDSHFESRISNGLHLLRRQLHPLVARGASGK